MIRGVHGVIYIISTFQLQLNDWDIMLAGLNCEIVFNWSNEDITGEPNSQITWW